MLSRFAGHIRLGDNATVIFSCVISTVDTASSSITAVVATCWMVHISLLKEDKPQVIGLLYGM